MESKAISAVKVTKLILSILISCAIVFTYVVYLIGCYKHSYGLTALSAVCIIMYMFCLRDIQKEVE